MYHDYAPGIILVLGALFTIGTWALDAPAQRARAWANRWEHRAR